MQNSSSTQDVPLDKPAFQSLYLENLSAIYRYVYSKVGNREVAEDLTSQVFIKAVRNLNYEYDAQRKRNWLFQVARTTIADYWRDFYRSGTSSLDVLLENGWGGPVQSEDGERFFDRIHSAERVQHILKALPERDREVLTCRFLLGLSVRETAERMGLTGVNVKVMQYRALKRAAGLECICKNP